MQNNKKNMLRQKIKSMKDKRSKQQPLTAPTFDIMSQVEKMMKEVATSEVQQCVDDLQKNQLLKHQFPELYEQYKPIYIATLRQQMDLNMLKFMLSQRERIVNKETTEFNASKDIGQLLFDKYSSPM